MNYVNGAKVTRCGRPAKVLYQVVIPEFGVHQLQFVELVVRVIQHFITDADGLGDVFHHQTQQLPARVEATMTHMVTHRSDCVWPSIQEVTAGHCVQGRSARSVVIQCKQRMITADFPNQEGNFFTNKFI